MFRCRDLRAVGIDCPHCRCTYMVCVCVCVCVCNPHDHCLCDYMYMYMYAYLNVLFDILGGRCVVLYVPFLSRHFAWINNVWCNYDNKGCTNTTLFPSTVLGGTRWRWLALCATLGPISSPRRRRLLNRLGEFQECPSVHVHQPTNQIRC